MHTRAPYQLGAEDCNFYLPQVDLKEILLALEVQ